MVDDRSSLHCITDLTAHLRSDAAMDELQRFPFMSAAQRKCFFVVLMICYIGVSVRDGHINQIINTYFFMNCLCLNLAQMHVVGCSCHKRGWFSFSNTYVEYTLNVTTSKWFFFNKKCSLYSNKFLDLYLCMVSFFYYFESLDPVISLSVPNFCLNPFMRHISPNILSPSPDSPDTPFSNHQFWIVSFLRGV